MQIQRLHNESRLSETPMFIGVCDYNAKDCEIVV